MSVERCSKPGCNRQVDTDLDTECVQPDPRHSLAGHPDIILCPNCRENWQHYLDLSEAVEGR